MVSAPEVAPFLKRLGNRLVSLLLFPVSLLQRLFAGGLHPFPSSAGLSGSGCSKALLAHNGLALMLPWCSKVSHPCTCPGKATDRRPGRFVTVGFANRGARAFD